MKKIKAILIVISLASFIVFFANISPAETLPKWIKVINGRIASVDAKNNRLTIEFKKTEGLPRRVKVEKLMINIWTSYKPTTILVNNQAGVLEDIKKGDIVKVAYEATPSAGNVAERIEVE